ncbi:glycoprotease family-domain-containing protein [Lactarius akahatsu]|uniref:N(6)-L-threonylcarbamoyladenine synthase n=1 Tax=Lactarius akahatsu TaxID=416441 RepID=A0AAD4LBI9_9AGAM|nr:glycoprotease family-domain-containing protein [Lactarius akahatsu]
MLSPSRFWPRGHRHLRTRLFTVLALESSADDTCAAVVTSTGQILSNIVVKQHHIHEDFGGIHPYKAVQAHQLNMPGAVQRALRDANIAAAQVDGIAFTRGPGMTGCLGVGCSAAKTLAAALNKPLVGVHHMQAHALTPTLTSAPNPPTFPFLTLLVSGGHTLLVLASSASQFRVLATTVDESIGRVFDKVSRMLALPWSAKGPGASLEEFVAASPAREDVAPLMPRAMPGVLGFSFAGLHSAVERFVTAQGGAASLDVSTKHGLASAFQRTAVGQLEEKVVLALRWCRDQGLGVRHLVVSGGVASNSYLRDRLGHSVINATRQDPVSLVFPPPELCTDNAVMIGWASMHRFLAGNTDEYSILIRPKWSLDDDIDIPQTES